MAFTTQPWQQVTSLPAAKNGGELLAFSNRLYLMAGSPTANPNCFEVLSTTLDADGNPGAWSKVSMVPGGRSGHGSLAWGNYLILVGGGKNDNSVSDRVTFFRMDAGAPTQYREDTLPSGSGNVRACEANGYLVVAGIGSTLTSTYTAVSAAKLNPDASLGRWVTGPALPVAQRLGALVSFGPYVYWIGGVNGGGTGLKTVYMSRIDSDGNMTAWVQVGTLSSARRQVVAWFVGNRLFVAGGKVSTASTTYLATVETAVVQADGSLSNFDSCTEILPVPIGSPGAVAVNGRAYLVGGVTDSNANSAAVQMVDLG